MKSLALGSLLFLIFIHCGQASFFNLLGHGKNNDVGRWEFHLPPMAKQKLDTFPANLFLPALDNFEIEFYPDHTFRGSSSMQMTGSPEAVYNPYTGVATGHDGITVTYTFRVEGIWGRFSDKPNMLRVMAIYSIDLQGGLAVTPVVVKRGFFALPMPIASDSGKVRIFRDPSDANGNCTVTAKYLGKAKGQSAGLPLLDGYGNPLDLGKVISKGDMWEFTKTIMNYYHSLEGWKKGAWIGVNLAEDNHRVIITDVVPNSPAWRANIPPGSQILSIDKNPGNPVAVNKEPVTTASHLSDYLKNQYPNDSLYLEIRTPNQEVQNVKLKMGAPPVSPDSLPPRVLPVLPQSSATIFNENSPEAEIAKQKLQLLLGRHYRGRLNVNAPGYKSPDVSIRIKEIHITGKKSESLYDIVVSCAYSNNTTGFTHTYNANGQATFNPDTSLGLMTFSFMDGTAQNCYRLEGSTLFYETKGHSPTLSARYVLQAR